MSEQYFLTLFLRSHYIHFCSSMSFLASGVSVRRRVHTLAFFSRAHKFQSTYSANTSWYLLWKLRISFQSRDESAPESSRQTKMKTKSRKRGIVIRTMAEPNIIEDKFSIASYSKQRKLTHSLATESIKLQMSSILTLIWLSRKLFHWEQLMT